jgi:hypothetical protein
MDMRDRVKGSVFMMNGRTTVVCDIECDENGSIVVLRERVISGCVGELKWDVVV